MLEKKEKFHKNMCDRLSDSNPAISGVVTERLNQLRHKRLLLMGSGIVLNV